ncbi:protein of unknown function [Bartonella clarridgeiae 73]|uniref:Uncharacterized protein n=1 Tax=Bartonella clarridgeiae (strain CCUG 45776 / CIP 104772 / 73) TaxID=696125 RepID=E6YIW5_BARC7|nr:protein of unknown function [Bartonella clarridgeiae 73]
METLVLQMPQRNCFRVKEILSVSKIQIIKIEQSFRLYLTIKLSNDVINGYDNIIKNIRSILTDLKIEENKFKEIPKTPKDIN